ncbi:MAG: zinc ABC transporter substrate-binding protein, partial [Lacticaseibacillus paracasei]|nr:zinc ABC transporter substrate-binding protein [Lacticaseibacillus paracasei]MDN6463197.1 zinc ABC transporter substrate-binding protein [Lacticaseibacillus paracasei]MDN6564792.1 zinc ABC transporter substrate-binding protein [Lacticaseibacillus paracasei]MDN6807299.1 zinc ABC transporter substrate-binding protein [Lacticaseibacillus paracasei]
MMKRLLAGISVALLAIFAVACGSNGAAKQSSSNGSKIQVVASLDFYGEVAKAVGGNKVSVQSIINNPAVDPHDYEPTTKVGKSVASADLVVASGIGYDGWMDKVVKSADKSKNYLRVADDLMNKKEGDNEHIWYDPRTMPKLANTLADKFAKKDPADKATFKANAKKYIASLDDLNTLINKLKSKVNGQLVDVSEPVFGYALDYLGYKVNDDHFSKSTEDGTDYSAKDIHGIETDIKEKKIAFFVNNIQASSKTVNQLVKLAEQNNVPVLKVTETLP